ncbi:MAG TPA: ATP-binding cassette domain-containing protein [Candidatus Saccharimonadales bacterium]|nr:ATP-binding cassette domain-containing protein [Candidatus Saccharimonadales bacterium]
MSSNTPLVAIDHFRMDFGKKTVIKDLSFTVAPGEIFGFLGSNGSGKTTTIRALLGLYEPTGGSLLINGQVFSPKHSKTLGYLPEERGLYKKEPVIDVMTYFGQLKGISRSDARKWSLDYLERVDLADHAKAKLDKLSGGQQQKVQLGVTIMSSPELLILDEPTKGFDPVNRRLLMDIIDEQNKKGAGVMMVTHQMEEVERLCSRALLLKDGKAEAYGTIDEIKDNFGGQRIMLRFKGAVPEKPSLYTITKSETSYAELTPKEDVGHDRILRELMSASNLDISTFDVRKPSLDEIFVSVYGAKKPDHA